MNTPTLKETKTNDLKEFRRLSQLIGEFMEYWGFKKIHGRIWVLIYLSDHPVDASEIMKRFKISKALVSITIKDLLEYEVIFETGPSEQGTRTYLANPNVANVIQKVLLKREKVLLNQIKTAFQRLDQVPKLEMEKQRINHNNLKNLEKLINKGDKMLSTLFVLM